MNACEKRTGNLPDRTHGAKNLMDGKSAGGDRGVRERLNELLRAADLEPVDEETARRFEDYLTLLLRWSSRTNLTSIRDTEGILARHFVESIACARALPAGIATLLDFGSGAGFPGLPIALCRPEIAVTLAESHSKKAAFLQEAVRTLGISVAIHADRAEMLHAHFDCVSLRAVDRMGEAVSAAVGLVNPGGWLALMATRGQGLELERAAGAAFRWELPVRLPGSEERLVALGRRSA